MDGTTKRNGWPLQPRNKDMPILTATHTPSQAPPNRTPIPRLLTRRRTPLPQAPATALPQAPATALAPAPVPLPSIELQCYHLYKLVSRTSK